MSAVRRLQCGTVKTTPSACLFAFIGAAESVRTATFCTLKLGSVTPPSGLSMWNHKRQQNPRRDVDLMTRLNIFPWIKWCAAVTFSDLQLWVWSEPFVALILVHWSQDGSRLEEKSFFYTNSVCLSKVLLHCQEAPSLVRSFIILSPDWDPASGFRDRPGLQLLNILLPQMNISNMLYSSLYCYGTSGTLAFVNTSCDLCCLGPVAALFFCRWDLYQTPLLHLYQVPNYIESILWSIRCI